MMLILFQVFFPQSGIDEDPVTGSALLADSIFGRSNRKKYFSKPFNGRIVGRLDCELKNDRVLMSGSAVLFLKGEIFA
jgi:predicted PhzF superfamily epimerase YddE/YHI9